MSMKLVRGFLAMGLLVFIYNGLGYADTAPKDTSQKAGTPNQTTYSPNDVIAPKTTGTDLLDIYDDKDNKDVRALFEEFIATQDNGYDLLQKVLALANPALPYTNREVIIIHAVSWERSTLNKLDVYQPVKGAWAFCRVDKKGKCQQDHDLSGNPYLYNAPNIYFIDLNYFPDAIGAGKGSFAYQITTTPRQKQNASSVATLVSALLKLPPIGALGKIEGTPQTPIAQVWGTTTTVKASSPIPYDLAISAMFTANKGNEIAVSCDKSACSFSKTVAHYDPEYWDLSLGVTVPGTLEPKYSSTGTLTSPTRHTDAYAFLDVYALQYFAEAPASLTYIPHVNLGIPISGQSLHRPYVGLAENLGFLTKRIKLNTALSVFAGPVFMKQQVFDTHTSKLTWDHATKMMYGVELPISSITKYMKGGSSK